MPDLHGLVVRLIRRVHLPHKRPFLTKLAIVDVAAISHVGPVITGKQAILALVGIEVIGAATVLHLGETVSRQAGDLVTLVCGDSTSDSKTGRQKRAFDVCINIGDVARLSGGAAREQQDRRSCNRATD